MSRTKFFMGLHRPATDYADFVETLTGSAVDPLKTQIVNPASPNPTVVANLSCLELKSNSGGGTSADVTANRLQSVGTKTSGVVAADFYAGSAYSIIPSLNFWVDNANRVVLLPHSTTGKARFFIVVGGVAVYSYEPATIDVFPYRWKIVITSGNAISCYYFNNDTNAWVQFGVTQTYNIGTNKRAVLAVGNVNTVTNFVRVDNLTFTDTDYSTRYPSSNYMFDTPLGVQELRHNPAPYCIGNYQYETSAIRVGNYTYIPWMAQGASSYDYCLYVYDHISKKLSDPIIANVTGLTYGAIDEHNTPVIYKFGDKLGMRINPRGTTNAFLTHVALSGAGFNAWSWGAWSVLDTLARSSEYPHYRTLSNGRIIAVERGNTGSGVTSTLYLDVLYSDDDGATWTRVPIIECLRGTTDQRPYPLICIEDDDEKIRVFINKIWYPSGSTIRQEEICYLECSDLVNFTDWQDVTGTFTYDVSVTPIDFETGMDDCVAHTIGSIDNIAIRANAAIVVDGYPLCVGGIDNSNNMGLIYYDGSAWVTKQLVCAGHTFAPSNVASGNKKSNTCVIGYEDGVLTLYVQEVVSTWLQVSKFTSSDMGDNWTFVEQLTSGNYDHATCKVSRKVNGFADRLLLITRYISSTQGNLIIVERT